MNGSRNTISEVIKLATENNLCWPLDDQLTNEKVYALLYPNKNQQLRQLHNRNKKWLYQPNQPARVAPVAILFITLSGTFSFFIKYIGNNKHPAVTQYFNTFVILLVRLLFIKEYISSKVIFSNCLFFFIKITFVFLHPKANPIPHYTRNTKNTKLHPQ